VHLFVFTPALVQKTKDLRWSWNCFIQWTKSNMSSPLLIPYNFRFSYASVYFYPARFPRVAWAACAMHDHLLSWRQQLVAPGRIHHSQFARLIYQRHQSFFVSRTLLGPLCNPLWLIRGICLCSFYAWILRTTPLQTP